MNDHFQSLDATVAAIRAECEGKLKEMSDRLLAAEIEATMAKDQLAKAIIAKEDAIQVASRLIERFALAEEALAGARKYATTFAPVPPADHPLLPKVEPELRPIDNDMGKLQASVASPLGEGKR